MRDSHNLTCGTRAKLGRGPDPAPRWLGGLLAKVLLALGPKGLEFGRYSIDYHYSRNWLYVQARARAAISDLVPSLGSLDGSCIRAMLLAEGGALRLQLLRPPRVAEVLGCVGLLMQHRMSSCVQPPLIAKVRPNGK